MQGTDWPFCSPSPVAVTCSPPRMGSMGLLFLSLLSLSLTPELAQLPLAFPCPTLLSFSFSGRRVKRKSTNDRSIPFFGAVRHCCNCFQNPFVPRIVRWSANGLEQHREVAELTAESWLERAANPPTLRFIETGLRLHTRCPSRNGTTRYVPASAYRFKGDSY